VLHVWDIDHRIMRHDVVSEFHCTAGIMIDRLSQALALERTSSTKLSRLSVILYNAASANNINVTFANDS